jgi:hypothetical protein
MSTIPRRCTKCAHITGGCNGSCAYHHPDYWSVPISAPAPKGCVCPPGSEATCQRSDCGRKDTSVKVR